MWRVPQACRCSVYEARTMGAGTSIYLLFVWLAFPFHCSMTNPNLIKSHTCTVTNRLKTLLSNSKSLSVGYADRSSSSLLTETASHRPIIVLNNDCVAHASSMLRNRLHGGGDSDDSDEPVSMPDAWEPEKIPNHSRQDLGDIDVEQMWKNYMASQKKEGRDDDSDDEREEKSSSMSIPTIPDEPPKINDK
jgi:hypothetical protein